MRPTYSRRHVLLALAASSLLPKTVLAAAPAPPERWVQNHTPTTVWARPDGALALAPAPQWGYFKVVGPPVKGRVPVFDPRIGTTGWLDAAAVGPSGPPPPVPVVPPAPPPKATFEPFWGAADQPLPLLGDGASDAAPLALVPAGTPLRVTGPTADGLVPVEEPLTKLHGWVDANALGRTDQPQLLRAFRWWGTVAADEAHARAEPNTAAPVVATYPAGTQLGFDNWVDGEQVVWDDPAWGEVAPGVYVYGRLTKPLALDEPPPAIVPEIPSGRWIGINRTVQLVVAYEDARPLFWARTSTGRPGWETPLGSFAIYRRVANETMDSHTLLGKDAERADYRVENVRFTQYFTADGDALHENWWKDPSTWGIPSSHGCAGLPSEDAERFWEFGAVGIPVIVHA